MPSKMQDKIDAIACVNLPAVRFESNKDFQTKGILYEGDSGFLRFRHKFIQPKGDTQSNREILTTLLSTQGDNTNDNVERLLAENISYRDLASLSDEDLQLMGFSRPKQRKELLEVFSLLPNQDPSLNQICNLKEAANYNRKIMDNVCNHLELMRSALAAANYKLQIMPPEDVIVDEKLFASRFLLEALKELYVVTDDIEKEILEIDNLVCEKLKSTKHTSDIGTSSNSFHSAMWLILGYLTGAGAAIALYLWKYRK